MTQGSGSGWASALVIGSISGIVLTADRLPRRVAVHFGAEGLANGFATREAYVALTVCVAVLAPAVVAIAIALSVRHFPRLLNLPNRDYWLAPARRDETAAYLMGHAAWLAAALAVFSLAIHLLVLRANHVVPARLETGSFVVALLAFGVMMVAWVGALARRFRRD